MSSQKPSEKTCEADGPIEDDKTAREKLRNVGFDPDDVHTGESDLFDQLYSQWYNITPMTHFACLGDLPMCRYLFHVRGASTTTVAEGHRTRSDKGVVWFPIMAAAYTYEVDTVKWLYLHGAKYQILEIDDEGSSAVSTFFSASEMSALREGSVDLAKWLVLEGLLEYGPAKPDARRLHHFLYDLQYENEFWEIEDMPRLFIDWMEDLLQPNVLFRIFLLGTVRDPQYSVSEMKRLLGEKIRSDEAASMLVDDAVSGGRAREIWDQLMADAGRTTSSNSCLASFPGVLEKIGDYVGIIKSKKKLKRAADAKFAVQSYVTVERLRRWSRR